jgi:DNA-directed RNA polymerase specialized sigma24 family protein
MMRDEDPTGRRILALFRGELVDPAGAKEAARLLNDDVIPRIIGVLTKLRTERIAAEEIAKEAVDKAVLSYAPGKARFSTYATRIALNIRVDRYRRGLLSPLSMQGLGEAALVQNTDPADPVEIDEASAESRFVRELNPLISLLSLEDRILIRLDLQGAPRESFMEIAAVGEGAYRQRKSRAYRRLQALYRKRHGEPGKKGRKE